MTIMNISMRGGGGKKVIAGSLKPAYFPVTSSPPEEYAGWSSLTVTAPDNLSAENIKKDVTIAGVTGTYYPEPALQTKSEKATAFPVELSPDDGFVGLKTATVTAPDNLAAENIKKDVSIAGVVGSYGGEKEVVALENYRIDETYAFLKNISSGNISDLTSGRSKANYKSVMFTGALTDVELLFTAGSKIIKRSGYDSQIYYLTTEEITTNKAYLYTNLSGTTRNYKAGTYTQMISYNIFGIMSVSRGSGSIVSNYIYGYYQTEPIETTIDVYNYGSGSGQITVNVPPITVPSLIIACENNWVNYIGATKYSASLYASMVYLDCKDFMEDA